MTKGPGEEGGRGCYWSVEGGWTPNAGGGRGLVRAWRRGVGVCLLLVAASFSFFLATSPRRAGFYTRVLLSFHHAPEYIMDIIVPSTNPSPPPPPGAREGQGGGAASTSPAGGEQQQQEEQQGFLVHTPGCIIPDFDPFHHTITRFISNPIMLTCKVPPALTSAEGTTLYYHEEVLRDNLHHYLTVYEETRLSSRTTTPAPTSSSTPNISTLPNHTKDSGASPTSPWGSRPAPTTGQREDSDLYLKSNGSSPEYRRSPPRAEVRCCYRAIYRVEQRPLMYTTAADSRWRYSEWCEPVVGAETTVKEEAVLVCCNISQVVVYKNVHYFIQRDKPQPPPAGLNYSVVADVESTNTSYVSDGGGTQSQEDPPPEQLEREDVEKLSVIIFGTDSASRLNMRRHLPKTYRYLTEELGAVDLAGFNKVGDNTFPNLIPVLSGLSTYELANHSCVPKREKFDDCHWIWKDFKKNGYVTAYMEDSPWMGMFNYLHNGFVTQPTDYYGRPFFMASEKEIGGAKHGNSNVCQGPKFSIQVIQDYSVEVARTFLDTPTFGLYWSASLSHDYMNMLRHADLPHLSYLRRLHDLGALNHTALFFVSDHGMRWGSIRSTYVGMLEERLPYVIIYLPPWFRVRYRRAFRNLQTNARRLTANYDLYQTLRDLAYGRFSDLRHVTTKPGPGARGISVFKEIPRERTCEDAGIPEHFCTCQETKEVPLDDPVLRLAADFLKESLNHDLDPFPECVQFSKISVVTGRVSGSNKELAPQDSTSDVRSYLLQAALSPGGVMVEATLRYNPQPQLFQVTGEVSRINKYGTTSSCIRHDVLRKLCFCKAQLPTPASG
nr:uncharacterized protein LOC123750557 [Procambarus clarkii]